MNLNLDMSNPIWFFATFLRALYTNVLTRFVIPGLTVSYWDLCIAFAVVGVVITGLISSIRIGSVIAGREAREGRHRLDREKIRHERFKKGDR